ncbi:MAG TPA: CoA transferase subunit A [Candidatus Atribacteria bacterium]|nr:CoA transferase subunit A [Candidatus Atribacteria bacterium]
MHGRTDKRMTLEDAVNEYVKDGCSIAYGAIAGREPMAVSYEIVRQRKKNLEFITDTTVDAAEILIAGGCLKKVECAYIWIGVVGSGLNYRRAMEEGIPNYLETEEYSNFGCSMRFLAGAMNVPYMPIKSLLGTDIIKHNPKIKTVDDFYGTGPLAFVPAARPDVAFIHVQRADKMGNAQIWGMIGNDDNLSRSAKRVILTCEEIIPTSEIRKIPNMTVIPSYCVKAVVEVPFCCHPLPVSGYYWMDIPFRREIVKASKTREGIVSWIDEWILKTKNFDSYKEKVGADRLARLHEMEMDNYHIPKIVTKE